MAVQLNHTIVWSSDPGYSAIFLAGLLDLRPKPNGNKIFIMLEELGIPYQTHFVDIDKREQFEPDFLAISPNNKIPALVDYDADGNPISIFESGAILTYLADKHGRFLAPSGQARWAAQAWLFCRSAASVR